MDVEFGTTEEQDLKKDLGEISSRLHDANLHNPKDLRGDEEPVFPEKTEKECVSCQQAIDAKRPGYLVSGKTFHQACFKCTTCCHEIDGKYFMIDNKQVCENCNKVESINCGVCDKDIEGDSLVSRGINYHSECMKCFECNNTLKGKYYTLDEKFICEDDYKRFEKSCNDCGATIQGPYYTVNNEEVVCEEDYKKRVGKCLKCRKPIRGQVYRISEDVVCHPDCFNCSACERSLTELKFNLDKGENKLYCNEDFNKKHAAVCYTCNEPIVPRDGEKTAKRLTALEKSFHPECFKCEDCKVSLKSSSTGSECYPVNNRPYCNECCKKRKGPK